jgi:hypothetical protein
MRARLPAMTSVEAAEKAKHYEQCLGALSPDDPLHVEYSDLMYEYLTYSALLERFENEPQEACS